MADATGFQILEFVDGGSANKGQDVHFKWRISDGKKEQELGFFLEHDKLPLLISHLITYGGLSRNTRMKQNPHEEADATYASGHALGLASVIPGRSVTNPDFAILTLQFHAGEGRKLNVYCAADAEGLTKLSSACEAALQNIQEGGQAPPTH